VTAARRIPAKGPAWAGAGVGWALAVALAWAAAEGPADAGPSAEGPALVSPDKGTAAFGPLSPRVEAPVGLGSPRPAPFFDARRRRTDYAGPGREAPEPAGAAEVLIGYFGPSDPADPLGGDLWRAASLAIEEANARGSHRGKPFRLLPVWSENPWGSGIARLARMVYGKEVWALVGGIDGPSTHLAEQVVAKARLALVSPVASDPSVNLANVPWTFSVAPDGERVAEALAGAVATQGVAGRLLLLASDGHDARVLAADVERALAQRGLGLLYRFRFRGGDEEALGAVARRVAGARPTAVVLAAGPVEAARMLRALRRAGVRAPVFGGPAMGRRALLEADGPAAEGVVFALPADPGAGRRFAEAFRRRFGRAPDWAARCTYDAVRMVVAAVERAGLNRARIRDALAALAPWPGAGGAVVWDGLGRNRRGVVLASVRGGRVIPLPAPGEPSSARTVSLPR